MTKKFLIGITFGVIGMAGMVNCYLSKNRRITEDDYKQKLIRKDFEDDSDDTDEFFDAETGSDILISDTNDLETRSRNEIVQTNDFRNETDSHNIQTNDFRNETDSHNIQTCDAASQTDRHIIEKNEYTILMEQRLQSLEGNGSKNRISIRIDRDPPRTQCHPCTPHACWAYLPPGSQPVYSGPTIPPPPVHSVPTTQPPPVHSVPTTQPSPVYSGPTIPPPPVHSVPMPPPPPIHSEPMIPPPPTHMPPPVPPSATTDFRTLIPPPPPPMMTTSTPAFRSNSQNTVEGSSLVAGPDKKATITYGRIPITTELLKSVVLKPPGERILKK